MLSAIIKDQTKTNHQLLEKKLVASMRNIRTKQDYLDLLMIFYSYFGGLEQLINDHLQKAAVPDYQLRRKAAAIANDIECLGGKLPALAGHHFLPGINSQADALGALYVIEGSTLGGKIISEMMARQLGNNECLSFFSGYGDETITMWKRFQAVLDSPESDPGEKIIAAANETFLKFSEWFDLNA